MLHLTWMEAESCKSSCCRRGRMDEDWVTSSKTNMLFGQRFDAAERRRHEFAVVDELSHQTTTTLSPLSKPPIFEAPTSSRSPT